MWWKLACIGLCLVWTCQMEFKGADKNPKIIEKKINGESEKTK
jgi:hypothetical protein